MAEGDSNSIFWGGNYTGIYAAANPEITFIGRAVGGSGLGSEEDRTTGKNSLWARLDADLALKPTHMTVLIGGNDMTGWRDTRDNNADPTDWLNHLFAYTDVLRSNGIKVAVATLLPKCVRDNPTFDGLYKIRRAAANDGIRAAVGHHIDVVIDFAADPRVGDEEDACNVELYSDGVHATSKAHAMLAEVYSPAVEALLRHR